MNGKHPGRSSAEEIADRMAFTAQAMTRLRANNLVVKEVSERFGVARRTVESWIRRVREQRRTDASTVDVDAARDAHRADLNAVASMALNRTMLVKDKEGNPVVDPNTGRPVVRANPDLGRALQAFRDLAALDGLAQPMRHEHKIEAKVDSAPDLRDLTPDQLAAAMAFVAKLAPDGDMAKLLGDHFALAGRRPELPVVDDAEAAPRDE